MAFNFVKKAQASIPAAAAAPAAASAPAASNKPAGFSALKRGAEAKALVTKSDAVWEAKKAMWGKMRRFYLPYNTDGKITFLDGPLGSDGMLDIPRWREHFLTVGNDKQTFICTADVDKETECPICATGDEPSLVGALTVIDHSKYTATKGKNAGTVYENQKRLFVAKDGTLKTLAKYASKPDRGTLRLCTFDVSRSGENKHPPAVGDTFDFVTKWATPQALAASMALKLEDVQPANYDEEVPYFTPDQLIEMGYGKKPGGIGYESGMKGAGNAASNM